MALMKNRQAYLNKRAHYQGRLLVRPGRAEGGIQPGTHRLGLEGRRDGLLYVPKGYRSDRLAPLALMLHGAGNHARGGLDPLLPFADKAGLLLLAPDSRESTWDVIRGGF